MYEPFSKHKLARYNNTKVPQINPWRRTPSRPLPSEKRVLTWKCARSATTKKEKATRVTLVKPQAVKFQQPRPDKLNTQPSIISPLLHSVKHSRTAETGTPQ